jgi:hypothetical protein
MSPEKYDQLWEDLILKAIKEYIKRHPSYEMKVSESKLKKDIWNIYHNEYKPQFKMEYMTDDLESADEIQLGGGKKIKIDRHKVAALLYLSIVCNDNKPFLGLMKQADRDSKAGMLACHEIAYSVSLNCIHSFIEESPNKQHKEKFLGNNGFSKSPELICDDCATYRDSIVPRMIWATETNDNKPSKLVSVNANMLANIFYFLELHSAS